VARENVREGSTIPVGWVDAPVVAVEPKPAATPPTSTTFWRRTAVKSERTWSPFDPTPSTSKRGQRGPAVVCAIADAQDRDVNDRIIPSNLCL